MKVLLIVGMQVDLLPGGPAEVPDSQELVPLINELAGKFDLVVAANFHMQPTHISFAANHPWRRPGQVININGVPLKLHNIFGVPGSFGAEFIPGLAERQIAFTAHMGTDENLPPYSAFFDADRRKDTGLAAFLAEKKVLDLYLAGMPLEEEVKNSALDSVALGFQTYLIRDASRGQTPEAVDKTLEELTGERVLVIPSHHI